MKRYKGFKISYFSNPDGHITAQVPAIRGCIAWGKTMENAFRNAVDAIESCLEARKKIAAMQ